MSLFSRGRRRAPGRAVTRSVDPYAPKHCAGGTNCTHIHADEVRCRCGQVFLTPGQSLVVGHPGTTGARRHSETACAQLSYTGPITGLPGPNDTPTPATPSREAVA